MTFATPTVTPFQFSFNEDFVKFEVTQTGREDVSFDRKQLQPNAIEGIEQMTPLQLDFCVQSFSFKADPDSEWLS